MVGAAWVQMKNWDRQMGKEVRKMDRQIANAQREEEKMTAEIKRTAKKDGYVSSEPP